MDLQQRTKRFGMYVILCASILRLSATGTPAAVARWLTDVNNVPFPTYLETGRNVRFSVSLEKIRDHFRESPAPCIPKGKTVSFSAEDVSFVEMDYDCTLRPDLEALLKEPLDWNLRGEEPTVLILHTHATESYTKEGEDYTETAHYRTLDEAYNMLSIGDAVAEILTREGIGVVHDRALHDYPSYNGSYVHARDSTDSFLEQYPSIRLILDLHRDASESKGRQLRTRATVNGKPSAQLMFVVGTNVSRQSHENWEKNLSLALKLHVLLERQIPGIMRPMNLRSQRFNQDLSPGALLVEVGAAGNTHAEALEAARALADTVTLLVQGTAAKGR